MNQWWNHHCKKWITCTGIYWTADIQARKAVILAVTLYERNVCNCVEKPENFRTSTGFELVTSQYWCDALICMNFAWTDTSIMVHGWRKFPHHIPDHYIIVVWHLNQRLHLKTQCRFIFHSFKGFHCNGSVLCGAIGLAAWEHFSYNWKLCSASKDVKPLLHVETFSWDLCATVLQNKFQEALHHVM